MSLCCIEIIKSLLSDISDGSLFSKEAKDAAVPTPWPIAATVAITRVDAKAVCVAEMFRSANIRFVILPEIQALKGIPLHY